MELDAPGGGLAVQADALNFGGGIYSVLVSVLVSVPAPAPVSE